MAALVNANIRVFLAALLAFSLSFVGIASNPIVALAEDVSAPLVNKAVLANAEVQEGEEISVSLEFVEDGLGLVSASANFWSINPDGSVGDTGFLLQESYYSDGSEPLFTGTISLSDKYIRGATAGSYFLAGVYTADAQGNERTYSRQSPDDPLVDSEGNVVDDSLARLTILDGGDDTAPLLSSIAMSWAQDEEQGLLQFDFDAVEEDSGIVRIDVELDSKSNVTDNSNIKGYYSLVDGATSPGVELKTGSYASASYNDGEYGEMPFSRPLYDGEYYFRQVSVLDAQGNETVYSIDYPGSTYDVLYDSSGSSSVDVNTIRVGDGPYDAVAPQVKSIEVLTEKVVRPGIAVFRVEIEENVGIQWMQINMWDENLNILPIGIPVVEVTSGTYEFEVSIPDSTPAGLYTLAGCDLEDFAGNRVTYDCWGYDNDSLTVLSEEIPASFETSIDNPNLLQMVENMEDGGVARIRVDMSGRDIIPAELFEAIDETNKTLWFYGGGIEWIFNGSSIKKENIKDVNPFFSVRTVRASEYGFVKYDLVELEFADNGVLPGRADMRLKMDYLSHMYDLSDGMLFLYYVDSEGGKQVLKPQDTSFFFGSDGYAEFSIRHNSTYVIAGEEPSGDEGGDVEEFNPPVGSRGVYYSADPRLWDWLGVFASDGSVFVSSGDEVAEGDTVSVSTSMVAPGYTYAGALVKTASGEKVPLREESMTGFEFTMPDESVIMSFRVVRSGAMHSVSLGEAKNGSISVTNSLEENAVEAAPGERLLVSVSPDPGYKIDRVEVCYNNGVEEVRASLDASGGSCAFVMPAYDVSIEAVFTEETSSDDSGDNGDLEGPGGSDAIPSGGSGSGSSSIASTGDATSVAAALIALAAAVSAVAMAVSRKVRA